MILPLRSPGFPGLAQCLHRADFAFRMGAPLCFPPHLPSKTNEIFFTVNCCIARRASEQSDAFY